MEKATTPTTETPKIKKSQVPNSNGVLAMGILSLVCFCCVPAGLFAITLGILAVVLGNKATKIYLSNPEIYTEKSYKNAKAGKVCGIISLSLGGVWVIGVLIYLSIIGWAIGAFLTTMPWDML